MTADSLNESHINSLIDLSRAYAEGHLDAGAQLLESVDEESIAQLPLEVRATIMDALMCGQKGALDERGSKLLRAALNATADEGFLLKKAQAYLSCGEQIAAETLLEWRALKSEAGSDMQIAALLDLAEVYQSAGKQSQARDIRAVAVRACEAGADQSSQKGLQAKLLVAVAQSCFDASDLSQTAVALKLALARLENVESRDDEVTAQERETMIDCLRLLHAVAEREQRSNDARSIAYRIQVLLGQKERIDEIDRVLLTYANLPDYFDLAVRPDGIDLVTDDFPKIVKESSGLDLEKYFVDAFSQSPGLSPEQRARLSADLFHVMRTVTKVETAAAGARLTRREETSLDLPPGLSGGYVQKINFGTTVTFMMVPHPPDEATFIDVTGITFSVGGKLIAMKDLSLKAEGNLCRVKPFLAECGNVRQSPTTRVDALTNFGKDILVGLRLKMPFTINLPIVLADYRRYLGDAINFKRALLYQEKDLLSFFERCARIEVQDPLTKALLQKGSRICRHVERIQVERQASSSCDLGGVSLAFASTVNLNMLKTRAELSISHVQGVDMNVAFNAPKQLRTIGLDLRRSIPSHIESIKLSLPKDGKRRLIVGTAPGKWVGLDLDERNMRPAADSNGHWMIFGVTSNPISGASQNFYLRLDRNNVLKMTTRELASLVSQTAIEGFDPSDPSTWQWGAVAIASETLLVAGSILRSTIGDEETDKIAGEVKEVAKFFKDLLF